MSSNTPFSFNAVILDMDGVITRTARLHAKAWKQMFDEFLEKQQGSNYQPLDIHHDYLTYIDGKARLDGVRSFLESRGIELPEGQPGDSLESETVHGLGKRKNKYFHQILEEEGVEVYKDTEKIVRQWKDEGIKLAVISASRNCKYVMEAAGMLELFDVRVDGEVSAEKNLKSKPAPDIFLEAAQQLQVNPSDTIVIEDAIAGVEAAKKGNFSLVVGVARSGEEEALKENGADVVISKLTELQHELHKRSIVRDPSSLPHALEKIQEIGRTMRERKPVFFFDYDGTLSPIVKNPDEALLPEKTRRVLNGLAEQVPVAVVSGRDRADVKEKVGLENVIYAGSHGFDISGPNGLEMQYEGGKKAQPALNEATKNLTEKLKDIEGCWVERKKYAIAVHFRNVAEEEVETVKSAVYEELNRLDELKKGGGKKILELKPDIDWHKGRATNWLLESLDLNDHRHIPFFIGDDVTDEDALEAIADKGIGILVGTHGEKTAATYRLSDTDEVAKFLEELHHLLKENSYG